jgi:aldehyde:ferredoxin oxidoreductase
VGGYARKFLRIDLPSERLSNAVFDEETLRQYIGGTGIGIMPYWEEMLENYYTPMG